MTSKMDQGCLKKYRKIYQLWTYQYGTPLFLQNLLIKRLIDGPASDRDMKKTALPLRIQSAVLIFELTLAVLNSPLLAV